MRLILVAALAFVPAAFAQQTLNLSGTNGNVLHPGIPMSGPPAVRGPGQVPSPVARSGDGRMGGGRIGGGRIGDGSQGGRRSFGGGAVYIPYPVYGGYGMGYGSDGFYPSVHNPAPGTYDPIFGGYNPGPGYAEPYPAQPAPATPTVIINQNFQTDTVRPQFRDYSNVPLPPPGAVLAPPAAAAPPSTASALADDQPTIFLIAMQDHTIYPVIAYWVQGDTLNYISVEGVPNHVSVALVDRGLSKQLNAERNVPFALPAAR